MTLGASIGIVVGGGLGGAALVICLIYVLCIREKKKEFKPSSQLGSQHSGANLLTSYSSSPLMTLDKSYSFSNGPASPRLYAHSEDVVGGAAYMFGMDPSSRQLNPEAPIMKDI